MSLSYKPEELMVVTAAKYIKNRQNVLVGIGLPMAAAILAKLTHAPKANIFFELGVVNPHSTDYGVGLADLKAWRGAEFFTSALDVLGMTLQRGLIDVGFVGVLEVDSYSNINSTLVKLEGGKIKHFTGSGGGNDIVSLAKKIVVVTYLQKRKFPKEVAFVTSPGYPKGYERHKAGLRGGDIEIVTDKAVLAFDKSVGRLGIKSIHPGVSLEEVLNNVGFELYVPQKILTTEPPTEYELKVLREKVPRSLYARE